MHRVVCGTGADRESAHNASAQLLAALPRGVEFGCLVNVAPTESEQALPAIPATSPPPPTYATTHPTHGVYTGLPIDRRYSRNVACAALCSKALAFRSSYDTAGAKERASSLRPVMLRKEYDFDSRASEFTAWCVSRPPTQPASNHRPIGLCLVGLAS